MVLILIRQEARNITQLKESNEIKIKDLCKKISRLLMSKAILTKIVYNFEDILEKGIILSENLLEKDQETLTKNDIELEMKEYLPNRNRCAII